MTPKAIPINDISFNPELLLESLTNCPLLFSVALPSVSVSTSAPDSIVGASVGIAVGTIVEEPEGAMVGKLVGVIVGGFEEPVGKSVGVIVGILVAAEGLRVGDNVISVGGIVGMKHTESSNVDEIAIGGSDTKE